MIYPNLLIKIPEWLERTVSDRDKIYPSVEDRMRLVIDFSRLSIENHGGPFGAGIFDMESHRLIAPGVNLVMALNCSIAHAEIMAIIISQQIVGNYTLNSPACPSYELVSSAEPCSQCFGAIPWAGIKQVVCGARREDVETIGFDEGPRPENWIHELTLRKIEVVRDVLRSEAVTVLREYQKEERQIYNG
jgi:tRNA(Arg) A34 adenosine deaminase TadA